MSLCFIVCLVTRDFVITKKSDFIMKSDFYKRRRPDLNWCVLVLQTIALPLGYCAIYIVYSFDTIAIITNKHYLVKA